VGQEVKTKTCCNCKKDFPGTLEFFGKNSSGKNDGLSYRCKTCNSEYHREWNKNKVKEAKPVETERVCEDCQQVFPLTDEFFQKQRKGISYSCRLCRSEKEKERRELKLVDGKRACTQCNQFLPATAEFFHNNGKHENGDPKLSAVCKPCRKHQNKDWYETRGRDQREADPKRFKEARRQFHQQNRDEQNRLAREQHRATREEAIQAYGGKCACCSESTFEFLGIDHVFEDGHEHRKKGSGIGGNIYYWLKKNNYPKDGRFQILCHNCNMAKAHYGGCPHQGPVPNKSLALRLNEARKRQEVIGAEIAVVEIRNGSA
jgi:hypothetical protein